MNRVAGVPIRDLEMPIREALSVYQEISDGQVSFDDKRAARLGLTPEKPNSARSETDFEYRGSVVGKLFVIAFAPGDGTGDESAYGLDNLMTDGLPQQPKIVPRSKAKVHSEGHLAIVSHETDTDRIDPLMFAGSLALLGIEEVTGDTRDEVIEIARIGQPLDQFRDLAWGINPSAYVGMRPTVTFTTGYDKAGERFGDPHAVYNDTDILQIAAFLSVREEHVGALDILGATQPHIYDEAQHNSLV